MGHILRAEKGNFLFRGAEADEAQRRPECTRVIAERKRHERHGEERGAHHGNGLVVIGDESR